MQINLKNLVLASMVESLEANKNAIIEANQKDILAIKSDESISIKDRLKIDYSKIEEMKSSLHKLISLEDPTHKIIDTFKAENGLIIENKTCAFGTILIIYESRPDVTIEAAGIAFKAGNKILLKGGKESFYSNIALVDCWQVALRKNNLSENYIQYLDFNREETQNFLRQPTQKIDLIVPRGGDALITFVKQHATCPVLVSGRGNNFLYIDQDANWDMAMKIIVNAKTQKVSACNALDKVLIHKNWLEKLDKIKELNDILFNHKIDIISNLSGFTKAINWSNIGFWEEEFLDYKIMIEAVDDIDNAILLINQYSGGHSATIVTNDEKNTKLFMDEVDVAAVYLNASTRFTDGGQFGMGAELAISTDKLHHRGPLGLDQLVSNKYYIYGSGQVR